MLHDDDSYQDDEATEALDREAEDERYDDGDDLSGYFDGSWGPL